MVAVVFKPVEINPDLLSIIFGDLFIVLGIVLAILAVRNLVKFLTTRESDRELQKLSHEWYENGKAVTNWLKAHHKELGIDTKATLSCPEFQELICKDFKIYDRLIILDPKLKEDPILNRGREFYGSLIRTENQRPN